MLGTWRGKWGPSKPHGQPGCVFIPVALRTAGEAPKGAQGGGGRSDFHFKVWIPKFKKNKNKMLNSFEKPVIFKNSHLINFKKSN